MHFKVFTSAVAIILTQGHLSIAASYSNPLEDSNGGDPNIVFHDGWYYMMSTKWSNLQMNRAETLGGLKEGESKVVWEDSDPSRCCNVWAPEMHNVDGIWHIYYSAGTSGAPDNQRSQVLQGGTTPWDAFSHLGTINTPDWSIDSTLLTVNGTNYFVDSCFSDVTGERLQSLCIAPLLSPAEIDASQRRVLSSPTAQWERSRTPVNEGAFALYHNGKTFLIFSASDCWTPEYQLGLLTYDGYGDPLDAASWAKTGPLFSSSNGNYGTGHGSFFQSPDGSETWLAYHSTPNSAGSCGDRYGNAKKIGFNDNDTPNFGTATTFNEELPGPAGEL